MHMNGGGYGDVGVVIGVMEFEGWNEMVETFVRVSVAMQTREA